MSTTVIVVLILSMILLFSSMILSSMASSEIQKRNYLNAQKYATWSSVVSGISVGLLVVVLIVYISSERIVSSVHSALGSAHSALGKYKKESVVV